MDNPKPVTVLFLDSLVHNEDHKAADKISPHQDQIQFCKPVSLTLIRIPQPGKDLYSKHISITQSQTIKNFQIYYRNLEKTNGKFNLLTSNNQLLASSKDDILITPKQAIYTDLLVIKGNFTKITLCIYGNIITDQDVLNQKCPNYACDAPVQSQALPLINMQGCEVFSTKDIFSEKSEVVKSLQKEIGQESGCESWHQIGNDDGINEQQIENICNISQKLLNSFSPQNLMQQAFIVSFRTSLQEIYANLTKVFKSKHLGLYYSAFENVLTLQIPLYLSDIVRQALSLSLSDQFRALQVLRYLLQLKNHATYFASQDGVTAIIQLFIQFFKIDSVVLSTFRILILQVLISLSHWKDAAQLLVMKNSIAKYRQLFTLQQQINMKQIKDSRSRSRDKKKKQSKSLQRESNFSQQNKKKKKKEKEGKKNKQKQRQRQKQKQREKQKHKHKQGKQSKSKIEVQKKKQEQKPTPFCPKSDISFYQIVLLMLNKQVNCKELILIKMLSEQILQTITKDKNVSQRVAQSTCLLKDTKYLLSQGGQIINNKSLKFFAGCQPFLNSVQSQKVDIDLICQKQKLKKAKLFNLSPIKFKMMNKILIDLAESQNKQNEFDIKNPYDEQFITIMSYLVRSNSQSILYGFNKILDCFKIDASSDISQLKKIQAAITMISQYIYKVLLSDQGAKTVMNIDQIHNSLITISSCLSKDSSVFTRDLKISIMHLTNYAMAYDNFTRADGNFKAFADYFLRLFKFQFFQINKISEFKKKQFQKYNKPFNFEQLQEIFTLGNFHQLLPDQPLLEIDVSLKIFIVLAEYNSNIWIQFYQYRLSSGFVNLFNKLSYLLLFLLDPSTQRQSTLTTMKKIQATVQSYLIVINHLLILLSKKCKYQSAFNELIEEDIFEDVQLYERALQVYLSIFNCLNQSNTLMSQKSKDYSKRILKNILTIYDLLVESYETINHQSREIKLKKVWENIYIMHYSKISSRAGVLSLLNFFTKTMQNSKIYVNYFLQQPFKIQQYLIQKTCYIPLNDKCIIQNVIRQNIFRSDQSVTHNLNIFLKNLLNRSFTNQKTAYILQTIFDELQGKFKELCPISQNNINLIQIKKMQIFLQHLQEVGYVFKNKLDEKLFRFLKFIQTIKMQRQFMADQKKILFYQCQLCLIKIKNNLLQYFRKSLKQNKQSNIFLAYLRVVSKNIAIAQHFLNINVQNSTIITQLQDKIQQQTLKSSLLLILTIGEACENPINQSNLLYGEYLQKPYKPAYQINLIKLLDKFVQNSQQINLRIKQNSQKESMCYIGKMIVGICYILCQLTTIEGKDFFSTQSRRNAIIGLVSQQKQFPFSKFQLFGDIIPAYFIQTLKDYFSYPIIEKQLSQLIAQTQINEKPQKKISVYYSKSIFNMISEGEAVAKTRYPLINGYWKGGDISKVNSTYCPFRIRDFALQIQLYLTKPESKTNQLLQSYLFRQFKCIRPPAEINQLFFLQIKRKNKGRNVEKKLVQSSIKLVNVPVFLKNTEPPKIQNSMYLKNSVSPQGNMGLGGQSYGSQQNFNMRKISPSPPVNRVTSQGLSPVAMSGNNLGSNFKQNFSYPMPVQNISNNGTLGNPINNDNFNRSHSSSLTRQGPNSANFNAPVGNYANNNEYYKGNNEGERNNYQSPYKSSKSMEGSFNGNTGNNTGYNNNNNNNNNFQSRNNYGNNNYADRGGYNSNSFNYPPNRDQYRNNNNYNHQNQPNRYNNPGNNYNSYNNANYVPNQNKSYSNNYNTNIPSYPPNNLYVNNNLPNVHNVPNVHNASTYPNYIPPVAFNNYPPAGNYIVPPVSNYGNNYPPNVNKNKYPPITPHLTTIVGVVPQYSSPSVLNNEEQLLYVQAVQLFNEMMNPSLAQSIKNEKRLMLNKILVNQKIQAKIKQYINVSKIKTNP